MTTKPEMTLENVCFRYDGSKEAKECFGAFREKTKCLWSPQEGMIYGIVDNKPKIDFAPVIGFIEISPSDYLLLLSAPESQAHLLTERSEPCGNCKETIKECACMRNICFKCNKPVGNITFSVCDECRNILHPPKNNSAKELLASQPPVMEGKEEDIYNLSVSALSTIRTIKDFCNNSGISKMAESAEKDLIKIFDNARDNVDSEKYANQKTAPLQDEIKSLRYDLFHVTANEQSLQSEVEQLKGLLKEAQPFCGTMLRGKIEHYTSK